VHRIEAYITLGLIFIGIITVLYLPVLFWLKKRGLSIIRQISYLGFISSLFLVIFATVLFVPITFVPERHVLNLKPFAWIGTVDTFQAFVAEKIPNVMLFVPVGIFIPIVFKRMRKLYKTALVSFAMTFGIEFFQYFIGRSSDIDDVITNVLGAVIGYLLFWLLNRTFDSKKWWHIFMGCK
jgi:glycopeptide antibiotics resistance protein